MNADHPVAQALQENQSRRAMWEGMMLHEGWREVLKYFEKRWMEVNQEDADSIKGLAARKARLDEIKKFFAFVSHDFKVEDLLMKEYLSLVDTDGAIENLMPPGF